VNAEVRPRGYRGSETSTAFVAAPLAGDGVDAALGRSGDDLVAALAQNSDGLRINQASAPMTTTFMVYPPGFDASEDNARA
jgi:hypothetical protein